MVRNFMPWKSAALVMACLLFVACLMARGLAEIGIDRRLDLSD